jgi:hypothetical protein
MHHHSDLPSIANDLKIDRVIKTSEECKFQQSNRDPHAAQKWCTAKYLNNTRPIQKTNNAFTHRRIINYVNYFTCEVLHRVLTATQ